MGFCGIEENIENCRVVVVQTSKTAAVVAAQTSKIAVTVAAQKIFAATLVAHRTFSSGCTNYKSERYVFLLLSKN